MLSKNLLKDFLINLALIASILVFIFIFKTIVYKNENIHSCATVVSKAIDKKYCAEIRENEHLYDAISKRSLGEVCECRRVLCEDGFYLVLTVKNAKAPKGEAVVYSGIYTEYESFVFTDVESYTDLALCADDASSPLTEISSVITPQVLYRGDAR